MKTMILIDYNRLPRHVNAFLRTNRITEFTANTFLSHEITGLDFLSFPSQDRISYDL